MQTLMLCAEFFGGKSSLLPTSSPQNLSNHYNEFAKISNKEVKQKKVSRPYACAVEAADLVCTHCGSNEWTVELCVEQGLINVPPNPQQD